MSRYDQRTTMFSPEGRVYQVEYALQSIEHAGASIGIVTADGIVFAAEKRIPSALLDTDLKSETSFSSDKMTQIDDHIACVIAGMTSDSNILIQYAREVAQQHRFTFREDIPVEDIAERIADLKQSYTQYGGLRPFGAALLIAGHDIHKGLQLYHTDPSGNYAAWKAMAIGNGSTTAMHFLKTEWKQGLRLEEGVSLALRTMAKVLDATLTEDKVEIGLVRLDEQKLTAEMLSTDKLKESMREVNARAKEEDDLLHCFHENVQMNKKTINTATANTEDPTPGYLFKEIIEMTFLEIATVQVLVDFLVSKVTEAIEYEYSHTLIKTLKIIRQMCEFGHVGFQNAMQQHVNELKEATAYRGGYSSTDGNAVRQNVKAAARQAIDALFVVRKEKPIAHATAMASSGSSSAAATKEALPAMYRKQHRKPLYVAPNVPLAPKPVFAPPPVQSVPEPVEARPQPQAEEPLNVKLVVYELIALPRDLESSDLHRFYDKCTALTDSHRDISFWEEVGSVLDHSFTNVRRLETVFNAVRLTEYLLKRDVAGVKEYFDVHRTNLKKLRRDIRVTLRPKIDRVFAILPEREEAEAAEASPIDIQAALPVEGGERQPVYDLTENDVPGRRESHRTRQYRPRLPLVPPARRPSTAMPEKPQVKQPTAPSIDDLFSSVHVSSTNSEDAETQEANAEEIQPEATKPIDFADLHDLILG